MDRKEYNKEWYDNNKEEIKRRKKERYENNKEYFKVYNKERYENNKEYFKAYHKERYENNKEYLKEYSKEYSQNNKEKIKEYSKEYRQTERGQMIFRISLWESRGVIYPNMKELYYTYKMTKYCHYCWVELVEGRYGSNRKCLDHNHETGEVRGILCQACNIRDVFKGC